MREVEYKFEIIRNGVRLTELESMGDASIRMSSSAKIKMALSGTFKKNNVFNPLKDKIKPSMKVNETEYMLGEYVVTTQNERRRNGETYVNIEAYDLTYLASRTKTEKMIHIGKGEKYVDIIEQLLVSSGIEKIIIEDSEAKLQTDREDWETGTSHLDIINKLLEEINYNSVWMDADGSVRITPYLIPTASSIKHTYRSGEASITKEDCASSTDLFEKYNVFRVEVSNADYPEPLVALAENDDIDSPTSTLNLGRVAAPIEKIDNIASIAELQKYVDNEKFKSMISTEIVEFETANIGDHGVSDIVALNHELLKGIFEEIEWNMGLSHTGTMRHKAKRVMYL